ncbi:MAG TPA: hypothetical protein VIM02_05865 [Rhizomicrobium sp.]|jgi:hypothetical protein
MDDEYEILNEKGDVVGTIQRKDDSPTVTEPFGLRLLLFSLFFGAILLVWIGGGIVLTLIRLFSGVPLEASSEWGFGISRWLGYLTAGGLFILYLRGIINASKEEKVGYLIEGLGTLVVVGGIVAGLWWLGHSH